MWVGPYEVVSELGRGGFGIVYKALDPGGAEVAVKLLRRTTSPEALGRFDRERRLLSAFGEADGFVPLLFAGETPGGPYLVMSFVPGGTLRDRLARGPLSLDATVKLGRELGRALGVAHARGIVHRDLKPENILYTADGRALVADLGLAKHFHHDSPGASQSISLSRTGELRGTAGYMAPEQAADAGAAGPEADVFALGAILYECLTGVRAFEGISVLDLLEKVSSGKVVPIRNHRPDAPRWLTRVVARALATDPADRYANGEQLGRALVEPRGSRRPLAVALAVLVLAAGAGVFFVAPRAPAVKPVVKPPVAVRERVSRLVVEALECVRVGHLDEASAKANAALELDPRSADALNARAMPHLERREWALAQPDIERALALVPEHVNALGNRALLRHGLGDIEGALRDATAAIALSPGDRHAWGNRGRIRLDQGDLEGAITDLDRAIEIKPGDATNFANRGIARQRKGDVAGAVADLRRSVELDPDRSPTWSSLANVLGELRDSQGSIDAAARAIELDPKNASAWGNRGTAHLDRGSLDAAISDLTRAIELAPEDLGALANRGDARRQKGDVEGARADLEHFLELSPSHPSAAGVKKLLESLPPRKP